MIFTTKENDMETSNVIRLSVKTLPPKSIITAEDLSKSADDNNQSEEDESTEATNVISFADKTQQAWEFFSRLPLVYYVFRGNWWWFKFRLTAEEEQKAIKMLPWLNKATNKIAEFQIPTFWEAMSPEVRVKKMVNFRIQKIAAGLEIKDGILNFYVESDIHSGYQEPDPSGKKEPNCFWHNTENRSDGIIQPPMEIQYFLKDM